MVRVAMEEGSPACVAPGTCRGREGAGVCGGGGLGFGIYGSRLIRVELIHSASPGN